MELSAFQARLAETAQAVERELDDLLGFEAQAGESVRPKRLIEATRYAALGGGSGSGPFSWSKPRARSAGPTRAEARRRGDRMRACLLAYP